MKTLFFLLLLFGTSFGANFVSNALGSNMVLQRAPQRAAIWGWSKQVGASISAQVAGVQYSAKAGAGGFWKLSLNPMPAGGPHTIHVTSSAGESETLSNVLFGDVWICGGQSNMQFTVSIGFNSTAEIKAADLYPNIRVFTVGEGTFSANPLEEFATIDQRWSISSAQSIGGPDWAHFSAVCWFFGKDLYDKLEVPIGLVSSNWGGTIIQAWSSPKALAQCNGLDQNHDTLEGPNDKSQLWNAMIVPLLNMRVKGATWYQAESNVGQTAYYTCAFPTMIADWRQNFGYIGDQFSFFFVQLAPWFPSDINLPFMRLAQTSALELPGVGMATAMDLGDAYSPQNNIHPRDKQDVGIRLSRAALAITYGDSVQYLGPTPLFAVSKSVIPTAVVEVFFRNDSLGSGIFLRSQPPCPPPVASSLCGNTYELQSTDGKWHVAQASVSAQNTLLVSAPLASGLVPISVRYLFVPWPLATLYNHGDYEFPAPPFVLEVLRK